jgi:xylulokinase
MSYSLGLDVSTTATKALLIDGDGAVVAIGRAEYGYETPRPLWSEQDPELWWQGTIAAIAEALAAAGVEGSDVAGVGLTGQMHGLVLLDTQQQVLRPSILWNDQRTSAECDEIRSLVGRERLIEITGNDALTGFTAPKILWVRNHEPDVFAATAHILLPKDYVRFRLSGEIATDRAGASGTQLFDLVERDWSAEIVGALGIPQEWLPPTGEGPEVQTVVSQAAAAATGLVAGAPIVAGAGDQAANAVGVGAVTEGIVAMSVGTSGVVFASSSQPVVEPEARLHAFCHAVPDTWHLMGVMLSAAGSYRWFRDALASELSFRSLDEAAAETAPGANGLVFLPYLTGERTPHPDPTARGAFVGLTVRHGLGHMARAVMEGVAYGLRDSVELMESMVAIDDVRVSGGGVAGAVWRQILADVLNREIRVVGTTESAAHGAAILAAVGAGGSPSVADATEAAVEIGPATAPGPAAGAYNERYGVYRDLYPALAGSFGRLSHFDG